LQIVFQGAARVQLVAEEAEQAAVPLFGGEVLADAGEVEDGDGYPFVTETGRRVDHQRALAHLAGGQQVTELPAAKLLVEVSIRLADHVGRRIVAQGATSHVEAGGGSRHSR